MPSSSQVSSTPLCSGSRFHERVFGLDGRHRLNGMRPADGSCARLGEAEVQDLALA